MEFSVVDGKVTIRGRVATEDENVRLDRYAHRINGVRGVANAVTVTGG